MGTKVSDMQKNVTPGRRKGCPNYPPEFKQQLVAASCEPGISISKLALENGINANLLFKWRQQWREGKLLLPSSESPQLLPVTLDAAAEQPESSIFSHPVYLFLREFSLQDFRGGSQC
ncbi:transposase [Escherichia coli]|nr:transposase [Escherichia coli]EFS9588728.1 transposase [Escherichia coli]